jgi:hypothetical protein
MPGARDGYAACCAAELVKAGDFDFLLLSLPDNDNYCHRHGPEASVESIAKADHCFSKLIDAAGGLETFLDEYALILLADHAQTPVRRGLPLAELLAREWAVLQPSGNRPEQAQLAVSPTGRAAHVYLLPGEGERAEHAEVRRRLAEMEGIDFVCWMEHGGVPVQRGEVGIDAAQTATAVVQRGGLQLRFRPGRDVADLRGGHWDLEGDPATLEARVEDGALRSEEYPDPLARVFAALSAPHAGDLIVSLTPGFEAVDLGGVAHVGGGGHGALHRGDSLGPLLFVGCGPEAPGEREQWALRDVAPIVLEHFGLDR